MIHERFNNQHPDLCTALRWKGQIIGVPHDSTVPTSHDGNYWCMYTQACIGPDGDVAEPGNCCGSTRGCHNGKHCE